MASTSKIENTFPPTGLIQIIFTLAGKTLTGEAIDSLQVDFKKKLLAFCDKIDDELRG